MPFFVILKRFEVWVLAAIVIALLIFAFRPEPGVTEAAPVISTAENPAVTTPHEVAEAPKVTEGITVRDVKVTGTKEGMIVELTLYGRSLSGKNIALDDTAITATTDEGEPVNRFFEPFRESPVLLASEDSLATLRWWLERPAGAIWLDFQGQRTKAALP